MSRTCVRCNGDCHADLAAAQAEIERLKEAQRAYEHEVMTGRNEQHARLTSEIERLRTELSKCQWHGAIDEAQADAATYLRERDEARAEIERLKEDLDEYQKKPLSRPHLDPKDCPTYYYGCNCTVDVLEHNIERAGKAEDRVRELEARPPIDRQRMVEALGALLKVRDDLLILPSVGAERIEGLADAILHHLGQPEKKGGAA